MFFANLFDFIASVDN